MNDDAEGAPANGGVRAPAFLLRRVLPATAAERRMREEGMARALQFGAKPYRDAEGKGRHIAFKEANQAPVEPWVRDPKAKRGYRRTQELRKAAGQLIGQPARPPLRGAEPGPGGDRRGDYRRGRFGSAGW